MSDLTDLYQQVILDHNRRPRNRGKLPSANRVAHGDNPTCGDQCDVYLRVDGDRIAEISFDGSGCAISQASASLMTTCRIRLPLATMRAQFNSSTTLFADRRSSIFGRRAALPSDAMAKNSRPLVH